MIDPADRLKAVEIYRRLFTQPRRLATLRAEFDAAVREASKKGTRPELVGHLRGSAVEIKQRMSGHWGTLVDGTESRPTLHAKKGEQTAEELHDLFVEYVEKTLHWLEYFVMDPSWLNLTAVNYAANAAREAANEVRQARLRFEEFYELDRADLSTDSTEPGHADEPGDQASGDHSSAA